MKVNSVDDEPKASLEEATAIEPSTSSPDAFVDARSAPTTFPSSVVARTRRPPSSSLDLLSSSGGTHRGPSSEMMLQSSGATSDLLSRIGSFLPKIRAANEELLQVEVEEGADDNDDEDHEDSRNVTNGNERTRKRKLHNRRIDVHLEPDDDSSSTSSSSTSASSALSSTSSSSSPSSSDGEAGDADNETSERIAGNLDGTGNRRPTAGSDEAITTTPGPMIEIHLALGTVEDNPIISWLAEDQETGPASDEDVVSLHETKPKGQGAAERLLLPGPKPPSSNVATGKGALITEM